MQMLNQVCTDIVVQYCVDLKVHLPFIHQAVWHWSIFQFGSNALFCKYLP